MRETEIAVNGEKMTKAILNEMILVENTVDKGIHTHKITNLATANTQSQFEQGMKKI